MEKSFSHLKVPEQLHVLPVQQRIPSGLLRINALFDNADYFKDKVETFGGWARTVRKQGKNMVFVTLTDGSTHQNLQVVIQECMPNFAEIQKQKVSSCFKIKGKVVDSPAEGQAVELLVDDPENHSVEILGSNLDTGRYPLSKKFHSVEHLRTNLHLRPRSNLIGAAMRVRNAISFATHLFFQANGFLYIHTPIITGSDCEGAGEMFGVSTMLNDDPKTIPLKKKKKTTDWKKDFFAKQAFLTVSGQLNVEPFACALTNVYTFGPTFRSEKSHTTRHLAEFWMIEPEMAFAGLDEDMAVAEEYTKFCLEYVLKNCKEDLAFFNEKIFQKRFKDQNLIEYLQKIVDGTFARLTYTEGIEILKKAVEGGHKFETPEDAEKDYNEITWGMDLGSVHERYICETHVKGPVFLYNYPKEIKAFYMRANEDGKTVQAMDMLVPLIGEVIGGSVREERYEVLEKKIKEHGLETEPYKFYQDLRKYGTVPHAGFGLGLERLIMMATGIENIRETIPYPRVEKFLEN